MIQRERYINLLASKQWNGRVKVVTGIRRCGKSTILFDLYKDRLLTSGVKREQIVELALDDDANEMYHNPRELSLYVRERIANSDEKYYLMIDEIQYAISKEELRNHDAPVRIYGVLNGLLRMNNVDIYVTGSNSKLLSKDVSTEFRGRGDVVHVYPLSFSEFYSARGGDKRDAYDEYMMFGGMPYLSMLGSDDEKYAYLSDLFEEIYFKDIEERYTIELPGVLRSLTNSLCSSIGSLTNASKISRTIKGVQRADVDPETVDTYLGYLQESFLFSKAQRYDVKRKRYFEYPSKYYCTDVGLRNVRLGLRQMEKTHIMENCLYNELLARGYSVDVGVVALREKDSKGSIKQKNCEIDFIARKGNRKYYVQSALSMDDSAKEKTELRPLLAIKDSFRKIVVSRSYGKSWVDEDGILRIGLIDFLLDQNSLDR
ncbi:ATP-binding protein [Curtanaerobium respiraculi]|uniref:ATP-binding protein n=1 Tax=Curtanaerobium respiraculi TaxID=2949669 RepID=UPI0024B32FCA|nr:ATP-binding protein [Curtanaerobium respiraculi]